MQLWGQLWPCSRETTSRRSLSHTFFGQIIAANFSRAPYGMLEIEPELATCKTSALPFIYYSLTPDIFLNQMNIFNMIWDHPFHGMPYGQLLKNAYTQQDTFLNKN